MATEANGEAGGPDGGPVRTSDVPGGQPVERASLVRSSIEWVVIIGVALLGAFIIRTLLFQAFFIPSPSMTPTLKVHDRLLVNKLSYDVHPVHRGDIVVFKRSALRGTSEGGIKDLVKRVIGLPGETVESSPDGHMEINGRELSEPYLPSGTPSTGVAPTIIPPGHYWVMGDNRTNSADSRVFGPIGKGQIVGRAFILIWPVQDFGLL